MNIAGSLVSFDCSQCGSSCTLDMDRKAFRCKSCGTKFRSDIQGDTVRLWVLDQQAGTMKDITTSLRNKCQRMIKDQDRSLKIRILERKSDKWSGTLIYAVCLIGVPGVVLALLLPYGCEKFGLPLKGLVVWVWIFALSPSGLCLSILLLLRSRIASLSHCVGKG